MKPVKNTSKLNRICFTFSRAASGYPRIARHLFTMDPITFANRANCHEVLRTEPTTNSFQTKNETLNYYYKMKVMTCQNWYNFWTTCMSGWHKVKLFALPVFDRSEYYVQISANRKEEFECCRVGKVPTPPVFAFFSDVILRDDGGAPDIWHIAIIEYVLIALLFFLATAHVAGAMLRPSIP